MKEQQKQYKNDLIFQRLLLRYFQRIRKRKLEDYKMKVIVSQ